MLTGATGHIGANVARQLLQEQHEVVALVRKSSDKKGIEGLPLTVVEGDLLDKSSLERACSGVDAVIHCAAEFAIWSPDPEKMLKSSKQGIENVLHAAAESGARRIVMTSSQAAIGASERSDELRSERDWLEAATVPYYRAKLEGERLAKRLAGELNLEAVFLLPTLVLGAHDHRMTPSMRPVLDVANGKQPTVPGGFNVVSVADVARVHVAALERGEPGERYLVGGDNVTMQELGAMVGAITGKPPKHVALPKWVALVAASVMEAGSAISGKPPALTRALVNDVFGKFAWIEGTKARATFGVEPLRAVTVVEDTLRWFLDQGRLVPHVASRVGAYLSGAQAA